MPSRTRQLWVLLLLAVLCPPFSVPFAAAQSAPAIPPIKRVLPPEGIAIPADVEKRLRSELDAATKAYEPLQKHELAPDIEVFLKAVRYALDLHEFYTDKDFAKADTLLKEANNRIKQLADGKHPWTTATGTVVRGYRSKIDDSAQPYGMVIPKDFDFKKSLPLYTWLHGRGDKATDIHFITERMKSAGEIAPPNTIVVHAFGRQCVGYLNAGEVDVIDVTMKAEEQYGTDPAKRVLIGFSMGGAGAWHVGAHYAHLFRVIAPGAGFAETAKYQKLKPEDYPPWYEQKLWGQNDAPDYVRNLFNTTVIAYSGELDRQIQAARVMEEAYQSEGRTLTHLIGPKTEHKYEPQTKAELLKRIEEALSAPLVEPQPHVSLQTRTLAYSRQKWLQVLQFKEHWQDTRADGAIVGQRFEITTKNVARLGLILRPALHDEAGRVQIKINDAEVNYTRQKRSEIEFCVLARSGDKWAPESADDGFKQTQRLLKRVGLQGSIDDAFCRRFLVVTPTGKSSNSRFQAWQEYELSHFRERWKALMRGDLREKKDFEVNADDIRESNLILWGDEASNLIIKRIALDIPIKRSGDHWLVGETKFTTADHAPQLIFPNPLDPNAFAARYIVLNSGLTFREGHDRTNSLQNPKLPDWAMIDITQNPDANSPGKVVNAGFFDEEWKLKPAGK
ncbi:alpha/beta hydrolase-fold protein [Anatilimnocola floriformis]|uniref:alpha/beta hydrolase-fold protein n=1 Tax=Anatilimnocola floriformis TaxID=2948575 RepID=UPI0020C4FC1F|nr:alpha/beta hydrolase-fold protein [Anatilimnocola floriformis]